MPIKENLWRDTIASIPKKSVPSVAPSTSVRDVVRVMQEHRTGCVTIREGTSLVGVFTERDLLKRVLCKRLDMGTPVSRVMSSDPATAAESEHVGTVIRRMRDGGYRHLPVVDSAGKLMGRISVREIVHYMVEYFPKDVYNLPPNPGQVQSSREGA
ncbi:MAG: cyclic nucleotide-binding/CBS domain-containing protein [Phycisphaerae bacterium]